MDKINWLQVIIGFLSGGAFGALIKQFFDNRRNRVQPIGREIELKSFFDSFSNKLVTSQLILTGNSKEYKFSKLYTGSISIINTGMNDYSSFVFGITSKKDAKFVQVLPVTKDKHHIAEITDAPALENQTNTFDVTLKPFNRNDDYTFNILLATDEIELTDADIQISSPHPTKWVDLVSTSKLILELARDTLISVGPISISLRR